MQIRHAPRYGVGGFNVAQLPGLDAIGPSRIAYEVCELVNAYLFVLAACGIVTRLVLPIATAIYAWLYFGSQLDSYQHHYLVALILLLCCFVPWERPEAPTPRTPIRTWALRLVLVQLAIMYLWAAISKMSAAWVDGRTLGDQITGPMRTMIDATIGIRRASIAVIGVELALAATVWNRRTWRYAAPLGLSLHIGILASGLEIGLFAWLMLGLYAFIIPDRVWTWLAETPPLRFVRDAAQIVSGWFAGGARWIVWFVACGLGLILAAVCRFDHAFLVGGIVFDGAIVVVAIVSRLRRRINLAWLGFAHLLALGTWTIVDRGSDVASDYYRFLGGSSRRFGSMDDAEHAYRRLVAMAPNDEAGHFHLGNTLLARDQVDEGLAELHEAERLEPNLARGFVAEARWLATHERAGDALIRAREATQADPNDAAARDLLNSLTNRGSNKPSATGSDDDNE
jgi:HTTM domain